MSTLALGILSSLAAEWVSWLNKKLADTPLRGSAAFLMSACIAVFAGTIEYSYFTPHSDVSDLRGLVTAIAQVFAIAQVWFHVVAANLKLEVK